MSRLPQPGSDDGTWGDILNDYLSVVHAPNGLLQTGVVSETTLVTALQTKINDAYGAVNDVANLQTALDTKADVSALGTKVILIDNAAALPAGTPAGVIVVVKS